MSPVTNIHIFKSDLFHYPVNMTVLRRCGSSSNIPTCGLSDSSAHPWWWWWWWTFSEQRGGRCFLVWLSRDVNEVRNARALRCVSAPRTMPLLGQKMALWHRNTCECQALGKGEWVYSESDAYFYIFITSYVIFHHPHHPFFPRLFLLSLILCSNCDLSLVFWLFCYIPK